MGNWNKRWSFFASRFIDGKTRPHTFPFLFFLSRAKSIAIWGGGSGVEEVCWHEHIDPDSIPPPFFHLATLGEEEEEEKFDFIFSGWDVERAILGGSWPGSQGSSQNEKMDVDWIW